MLTLTITYLTAEIICMLIAWIALRGLGWGPWGIQRIYLAVMLITELTGLLFRYVFGLNNLPVYNAYIVVEAVTVSWVLYRFIQPLIHMRINRWWWGWLVLFGVCYAAEWALDTRPYLYVNHSILLMNFVFAAAACFYFARLVAVRPGQRFRDMPESWWMAGTALFYITGMGNNLFFDLFTVQPYAIGKFFLHDLIAAMFTVVTCVLWSIAFVRLNTQRSSG